MYFSAARVLTLRWERETRSWKREENVKWIEEEILFSGSLTRQGRIETLAVFDISTQPPCTQQCRAFPSDVHTRALKEQAPHSLHCIPKIWGAHKIRPAFQIFWFVCPAVCVDEIVPELVIHRPADTPNTCSRYDKLPFVTEQRVLAFGAVVDLVVVPGKESRGVMPGESVTAVLAGADV
jgi:hypothetical protein